jgi:heat shock protein HtpX
VNPLSGSGLQGLFSTHPSTEQRIERLEEIAQSMGRGVGRAAPAPAQGRSGTVPSAGSLPRRSGPWG